MREGNQLSSGTTARRRSSAGLDSLSQRFQRFRTSHPRGARIPVPLRKAVVVALRNGASRSSVQKACGVSWEQMERWQARYGNQAVDARRPRPGVATTRLVGTDNTRSGSRQPTPPPRVFSVVDDEQAGQAATPHKAPLLELRVSGWSISLQQLPSDIEGAR